MSPAFHRNRLRAAPASAAALAALALAAPRGACAELLLNEILYDPAGTDAGAEFVEIWNPDSAAVSLAGVVIEACDGANPGAWVPLHAGGASDSIPARSAYLVEAASLAAPIQNGPDAVRLVQGGRVLDLVGYGVLAAPGLCEGVPAADVASGESLARRVDGADTDVNADDWVAEPSPTPGRANRPDFRISFVRGESRVDPEVAWPGETMTIRLSVRNSGAIATVGSRWRVEADLLGADSVWTWIPGADGVPLRPEERASVAARFPPPTPGGFLARARLVDAGPEGTAREIADTLSLRARSGAGPAVLSEIAFRDRGAGEWIELRFLEPIEDLGRIALADRSSDPVPIDRGPAPRAARAGDYLVVAESPGELRARYALPESVVLGLAAPWPALNDEDAGDGIADLVRVVAVSGDPWDAVPYRASSAARDGSLERLDPSLPSASPTTWAETIDPAAGTPGRANSLRAPDPGRGPGSPLLVASARVLRRAPGLPVRPVVLRVVPAAGGVRLRVRVHDLLGRPRRLLVDGQRLLADAAFLWDGRDDAGEPLPPGIYVVRAETIPEEGAAPRSAGLAVTVSDRGPR